jgi:hypothetical protein
MFFLSVYGTGVSFLIHELICRRLQTDLVLNHNAYKADRHDPSAYVRWIGRNSRNRCMGDSQTKRPPDGARQRFRYRARGNYQ